MKGAKITGGRTASPISDDRWVILDSDFAKKERALNYSMGDSLQIIDATPDATCILGFLASLVGYFICFFVAT